MPQDNRWSCLSRSCTSFPHCSPSTVGQRYFNVLWSADSMNMNDKQDTSKTSATLETPGAVARQTSNCRYICPHSDTLLPARCTDAHGTWWREEDRRECRCLKKAFHSIHKEKKWSNRGAKEGKGERWRVKSRVEDEEEMAISGDNWKAKITEEGVANRRKEEKVKSREGAEWREGRRKREGEM